MKHQDIASSTMNRFCLLLHWFGSSKNSLFHSIEDLEITIIIIITSLIRYVIQSGAN